MSGMPVIAAASPRPALPVVGYDRPFPVRRIYCVGRNYAKHIAEMGRRPDDEPPFFFLKPIEALVPGGGEVPYPLGTANFHHEVELVLALGTGGVALTPAQAGEAIFGFAVGLDLTRRDLQLAARDSGRPWDAGKAFDRSAPCGPIVPAASLAAAPSGRISLEVNGAMRQDASLAEMVWSPVEIVAALSRLYELAAGDLIFTGTPEGVGPLAVGDVAVARIDGLPECAIRIEPPLLNRTSPEHRIHA